eukprot:g3167.t1
MAIEQSVNLKLAAAEAREAGDCAVQGDQASIKQLQDPSLRRPYSAEPESHDTFKDAVQGICLDVVVGLLRPLIGPLVSLSPSSSSSSASSKKKKDFMALETDAIRAALIKQQLGGGAGGDFIREFANTQLFAEFVEERKHFWYQVTPDHDKVAKYLRKVLKDVKRGSKQKSSSSSSSSSQDSFSDTNCGSVTIKVIMPPEKDRSLASASAAAAPVPAVASSTTSPSSSAAAASSSSATTMQASSALPVVWCLRSEYMAKKKTMEKENLGDHHHQAIQDIHVRHRARVQHHHHNRGLGGRGGGGLGLNLGRTPRKTPRTKGKKGGGASTRRRRYADEGRGALTGGLAGGGGRQLQFGGGGGDAAGATAVAAAVAGGDGHPDDLAADDLESFEAFEAWVKQLRQAPRGDGRDRALRQVLDRSHYVAYWEAVDCALDACEFYFQEEIECATPAAATPAAATPAAATSRLLDWARGVDLVSETITTLARQGYLPQVVRLAAKVNQERGRLLAAQNPIPGLTFNGSFYSSLPTGLSSESRSFEVTFSLARFDSLGFYLAPVCADPAAGTMRGARIDSFCDPGGTKGKTKAFERTYAPPDVERRATLRAGHIITSVNGAPCKGQEYRLILEKIQHHKSRKVSSSSTISLGFTNPLEPVDAVYSYVLTFDDLRRGLRERKPELFWNLALWLTMLGADVAILFEEPQAQEDDDNEKEEAAVAAAAAAAAAAAVAGKGNSEGDGHTMTTVSLGAPTPEPTSAATPSRLLSDLPANHPETPSPGMRGRSELTDRKQRKLTWQLKRLEKRLRMEREVEQSRIAALEREVARQRSNIRVVARIRPSTSQGDIFRGEIRALVGLGALEGHHVCVFAYGQTGSGKTYTMQGSVDAGSTTTSGGAGGGGKTISGSMLAREALGPNAGVMPRTLLEVARTLTAAKEKMTHRGSPARGSGLNGAGGAAKAAGGGGGGESDESENAAGGTDQEFEAVVEVSVVELYGDKVVDLLAAGAAGGGKSQEGRNNKAESRPGVQLSCGRDGSVSAIGLTQHKASMTTGDPLDDARKAWAVIQGGLANRTVADNGVNVGSSRSHCVVTLQVRTVVKSAVGGTGGNGEGQKAAATHVPYRDSKLTMLLKDCLGGSAKSLMICQICLFCYCFAAIAVASEAENAKDGSKAFGFTAVWLAFQGIALGVWGTLNMKYRPTPYKIGVVVGTSALMAAQMFTMAIMAGGNLAFADSSKSTGHEADSPGEKAAAAFAVFSFIAYAAFGVVLAKKQHEIIPGAFAALRPPQHQYLEEDDDDDDEERGGGGGDVEQGTTAVDLRTLNPAL